ncbi:SOS response-associated peptidase family protein [Pelagerythrobacter marensis]|uniref:Abasic site processing protein n=1 Tax=Pelagerythrobacter marensis TaxID=543877 RepID=A0ABZ2D233_9SPHN
MCNLYRIKSADAEIARLFGVEGTAGNTAEEVYPKYPGLVIAQGRLRTMTWGFPREQISKKTGKPLKPTAVNNARSDQLVNPFGMWRDSFERRRCLIPLTAWAEAEGPKGAMTRTWMSLPDQPVFAVAGIWRGSEEWGDCYSMVMTDAAGAAAEVHNRMPVILRPEEYARWQDAAPEEARALCRGYEGEVSIDRTRDPWRRT